MRKPVLLPMSWELPENNVKNLQSFLGSICLAASQELTKMVQISTCCKLNHHLEIPFPSAITTKLQL
jgi:hypothetical protein